MGIRPKSKYPRKSLPPSLKYENVDGRTRTNYDYSYDNRTQNFTEEFSSELKRTHRNKVIKIFEKIFDIRVVTVIGVDILPQLSPLKKYFNTTPPLLDSKHFTNFHTERFLYDTFVNNLSYYFLLNFYFIFFCLFLFLVFPFNLTSSKLGLDTTK